jgi:hypothetical protein
MSGRSEESVETDRKRPQAVCARPHPLLDEVYCGRLRGHPGRHGAYVDSPSTEMTVEWEDAEEQAG